MNIAKKSKFLLLFVFSIVALVGSGVAAQEVELLRMGITGDESTLNPYSYVTGNPGWNMLLLQYDTLYQLDESGVPQPWLATGSEVSEDGLTVTIDLRDDVMWHDGTALTANDVKFTVDYFKEWSHGRFTRDLRPVESAEVDGDSRIIFTLTSVTPNLEMAAFSDVPILPAHIWADITDPNEANLDIETNIGSGPYKLTRYEPDQFYRFEANVDYFAGTPQVSELVFVKFADTIGAMAALQANEIDMVVVSAPPEQVELLSGTPDISVIQGPLFTTAMVNYDIERAPFDQLVVRQAMSMAIDRQDIVDTVYLGQATVGSVGWTHPLSAYANPDIVSEYDVVAANQLLEDAGIVDSDDDGIRELDGESLNVDFLAASNRPLTIRIAGLVKEMLLEIGINADVMVVEASTWEDAVWPGFDVNQGRNYDMSMWGWSAPVQADPIRIGSLVHSDPSVGSLNLTGYNNARIDELSVELGQTLDVDRQLELFYEIQAIIAEELPFIMLLYPDAVYAYRPAVYDNWGFMSGQGIFHKLSFLDSDDRP